MLKRVKGKCLLPCYKERGGGGWEQNICYHVAARVHTDKLE